MTDKKIIIEPIPLERALEEAYKAGIREVVEWADQDCDCGMNLLATHWQCSICKQAKLKEWGLDEQ